MNKKSQKIVIVGNGFDLNLGLKSSFKDFFLSKYAVNENGFIYDERKQDGLADRWSSLEKSLEETAGSKFMNNWKAFDPKNKQISFETQISFNRKIMITDAELMRYLDDQEKYIKKTSKKLLSSHVLNKLETADSIINFNYTNTIQNMYNPIAEINKKSLKDKIYFIHGSIKENNIIIGTSNDLTFAGSTSKFKKLMKQYLRDILSFKRWYKKMHDKSTDFKELIREFKEFDLHYYDWLKIDPKLNNSKIISNLIELNSYYEEGSHYFIDNAFKDWKTSNKRLVKTIVKQIFDLNVITPCITNYIAKNMFRPFKIQLPGNIDFEKVDEISIIGHSLYSDKEIISDLLKSCMWLKKVNIFRYQYEYKSELEDQFNFVKRNVAYPEHVLITFADY